MQQAMFYSGQFLEKEGLDKLNKIFAASGKNFRFSLINQPTLQIKNPTIGIVIAGAGEIKGPVSGEFEQNDLLYLDRGRYQIESFDFKILTVTGTNLFEESKIIKQKEHPILPSTLGGTRKLLKQDEGKFNIDVHLIWVDEKNIKIPHYHTKLFELYLVEQGNGEILLKDKNSKEYQAGPKLAPGRFVLVYPHTVHRAQGRGLVIHVVGIPAFYSDDSYVVE